MCVLNCFFKVVESVIRSEQSVVRFVARDRIFNVVCVDTDVWRVSNNGVVGGV